MVRSKSLIKGRRRTGDSGRSSTATAANESERRKLFWAFVEKDRLEDGDDYGDDSEEKEDDDNDNDVQVDIGDVPLRSSVVDIGVGNIHQWTWLKEAHGYENDSEFASFLLDSLAQVSSSNKKSTKTTKVASSNKKMSAFPVNNDDYDSQCGSGRSESKTYSEDIGKSNSGSDDAIEDEKEENDDERGGDGVSQAEDEGANNSDASSSSTEQSDECEDSTDVEWTIASERCGTRRSTRETTRRTLRQTRSRLNAASTRKSPRKRSSSPSKAQETNKVLVRHCLYCSKGHPDAECPLLQPKVIVVDSLVNSDDIRFSFAQSTLPNMLNLSTIDERHGLSVISAERITRNTQFGPLLGVRIKESDIHEDDDLKFIWEVFSDELKMYVGTINDNASNWLRYVRPAMSKEDRNMSTIVRGGSLYFVTTKDVEAGCELTYWSEDPTLSWSKDIPLKTRCSVCNKKFYSPLYYRMHCVLFHDSNHSFAIRKYHCKICGVVILTKENILRHASEMHNGKGAFQCQYCRKFFSRRNSVDTHRSYHCELNPRRSRPLCELCGKEFSSPPKLKVHIRRMHSENSEVLKEFQCQSCLKLMSSHTSLQRHMNEVHKQNQNGATTCDRCGKVFRNASNLKIHMLTHSGVKPFQCSEKDCKAAFTTKQCLQFHYKKVHCYTSENMPAINRCIAYTFGNYSGDISDTPADQVNRTLGHSG